MDILELSRGVAELKERFLRTQVGTDELCLPLSPEDCLLSVTEETSPPKWHLGHTTWFYARFILERFTSYEVTPEFHFVFNSYYKGVGPHIEKSSRRCISRPALAEVLEWRADVRERVLEFLEGMSVDEIKEVKEVLELGINHEEQHQELLLMDIKRNFFENPQKPRYKSRVLSEAKEHHYSHWVNIPSGLVKIGVSVGEESFHYDNESDSHLKWIDSFMLMSHPVTNEEYLQFILDGGYLTSRYWLSDGWDLLQKENWTHPLYWEERDGEWWMFTLSGMLPLDLAAPVCHVSYYEADAFARYRGKQNRCCPFGCATCPNLYG